MKPFPLCGSEERYSTRLHDRCVDSGYCSGANKSCEDKAVRRPYSVHGKRCYRTLEHELFRVTIDIQYSYREKALVHVLNSFRKRLVSGLHI